jgi:Protein of unknown function
LPELLGKALTFGGICALSALVANLGVSVYHDGLRALMPEYRRGEWSHNLIGRRAWDISIGFILFFGLPFSLVTGVMVSHVIFLPADIIGLAISSRIAATGVAALYGAGAALAIEGIYHVFSTLPVAFLPDLSLLVVPLVFLIGVMPVLVAAQQFGLKWGAVAAILAAVAMIAGSALDIEEDLARFGPSGLALVVGTAFLFVLSLRRKGTPIPDEAELFRDQIGLLRSALPYLLGVGILSALAAHFLWLAGEPAATLLVGAERTGDAAAVALFSALGFMPMVVSLSVVSGAYTTQGYPDWVLAAGYVMPNPIAACIAGAGVMGLEIGAVKWWMHLLGRFPDLRELGASIRDALTHITEVGTLVGGFVAANAIWEGYGIVVVGLFYVLNEAADRPVMRLAVGPLGALATGLIVNLIWLFD